MKRRICILLAAVVLMLVMTPHVKVMAERNDFMVWVSSLPDAFNERHEDNYDFDPWREVMFSKLQGEIQSGRTPDLIRVFEDIDTFKKIGAIVPFTPSEELVNDLETMPPLSGKH